MDKSTIENYQRQATGAGNFRKVPVSSKHLLELCKVYQKHLVDANKKVEAVPWEDMQINQFTRVETMG